MQSNTEGNYNIAIGNTLQSNTEGNYNIAIGNALQSNTTGSTNIALGNGALSGNDTGSYNIAVGDVVLENNTTGSSNIGIGEGALNSNDTGSYNIAIGAGALSNNIEGYSNLAVGYQALIANDTGFDNVAVGIALLNNTTGSNNVAIGNGGLENNTDGSYNTAIGYNSGINATGSNNTYLGYNTSNLDGIGFNNSTAIGQNTQITADNQITLGTASETVYIPGSLICDSFVGATGLLSSNGYNYPEGSINVTSPIFPTTTIAQVTTTTSTQKVLVIGSLEFLTSSIGQTAITIGVGTNPTPSTSYINLANNIAFSTTDLAIADASGEQDNLNTSLSTVYSVTSNKGQSLNATTVHSPGAAGTYYYCIRFASSPSSNIYFRNVNIITLVT